MDLLDDSKTKDLLDDSKRNLENEIDQQWVKRAKITSDDTSGDFEADCATSIDDRAFDDIQDNGVISTYDNTLGDWGGKNQLLTKPSDLYYDLEKILKSPLDNFLFEKTPITHICNKQCDSDCVFSNAHIVNLFTGTPISTQKSEEPNLLSCFLNGTSSEFGDMSPPVDFLAKQESNNSTFWGIGADADLEFSPKIFSKDWVE